MYVRTAKLMHANTRIRTCTEAHADITNVCTNMQATCRSFIRTVHASTRDCCSPPSLWHLGAVIGSYNLFSRHRLLLVASADLLHDIPEQRRVGIERQTQADSMLLHAHTCTHTQHFLATERLPGQQLATGRLPGLTAGHWKAIRRIPCKPLCQELRGQKNNNHKTSIFENMCFPWFPYMFVNRPRAS